ncbi:unnamed protein product, partial [Closterium sp. NIES-53]
GDPDALDIPTPRSYAEAVEGPYSSQWQAAMDAEMASWKSTGTYVDEVPPFGANIVDGMWIFRVKRPPGSPPIFKARYVARGFSQRQGVDYFQTFSPTPKMATLRVLLHVATQRDYELHSLDLSTAFLQGSLDKEIWLHRPPAAPSTADPSLFLRTDTSLPPFYILLYVLQRFDFQYSSPQSTPLPTGHSLSALPSDESVEPSGLYPELVGCLMYLMTCTRPDLAYPLSILARYVAPGRHRPEHWKAAKRVMRYLCSTSGMGLVLRGRGPVVLSCHADASWVDDLATQRPSQGYTFSLGSGSVSWRSTRSSSVLSSSCEAEIYATAMAAQELRWLTYLLPTWARRLVLLSFIQLQQRGQLRLAHVATRANTADIFTKALLSACFAFLDWSCDLLLSPTLPMGYITLYFSLNSQSSSCLVSKMVLAAGAGGTGVRGIGARGAGVGGTGAGGAGAGGAGVVDRGGAVWPRPYFVPLLQQVFGTPSSTSLTPPLLCPPPGQSQPPLQAASSLPAPSPYTEQSGGLTEHRLPASGPVSPARTTRRVPRPRPPPVPDTHAMTLRPSSIPLRVPLPAPPESSLPKVANLESNRTRAASPTVSRLLATAVTDPSFESAAVSALVAELLDFAAACRLDYATALFAESASTSPPSVEGECALGRDGVDYFHTFSPTSKMTTLWVLLHVAAQRDYELHSLDFSTAFLQGSLHEEIWLRHPPGFTGSFPAGTQWTLRRPVYGLRQAPREWHDTLRTTLAALGSAPSTADPSLFLCTDTSLPPFYVLVYVDDLVFATADTEALTLVKSELQKRHTCTDLGELRSYLGLQITRDRAQRTITLNQSHMVHQVLQRFGFQFSSPQPSPLSTSHSLSAPPSDKSVEPSGPYPELVGCVIYLMTCTRPDLAYPLSLRARYVAPGRHRKVHWDVAKRVLCYLCSTSGMGLVLGGRGLVVLSGHADASWVDDSATQRSSQGYTFSLGSGSVSWRSTRSSLVLSSSCEDEIYAGAMAAQELRWLTYLVTDLGE